jgi:hypothetical protein
MNSGQEHQWHIELEPVIEMLEELCEITKGETA